MTDLPDCVHRSTGGWFWHHRRGEFLDIIVQADVTVYTESLNVMCKDAKGCPEGLKT